MRQVTGAEFLKQFLVLVQDWRLICLLLLRVCRGVVGLSHRRLLNDRLLEYRGLLSGLLWSEAGGRVDLTVIVRVPILLGGVTRRRSHGGELVS